MISKQLIDLAGPSGTLQLNFQATLDDARKQLVTELEKQSGLLMGQREGRFRQVNADEVSRKSRGD